MLGERRKSCLLSFVFFLSLTSSVRAAETPIVRVGVFENPPIVSIRDATHPQGIAIDVLDYVAEHEPWRIQYIPAAWGELLRLMDAGQLDVVVGMAYSRSVRKNINSIVKVCSEIGALFIVVPAMRFFRRWTCKKNASR